MDGLWAFLTHLSITFKLASAQNTFLLTRSTHGKALYSFEANLELQQNDASLATGCIVILLNFIASLLVV